VRTNIVIDDDLMAAALAARPNSTKRAVVEEGLKLLALVHRQKKVRSLRGKLPWAGDLETMRRDRPFLSKAKRAVTWYWRIRRSGSTTLRAS
jgi:Arc/MetJ family transcription regulator